jgi:hypothetical protein
MNTQEVDYSAVFDILEDIFGDYKNHNDYRYQVSFDCPVCSHEIKGLDKGETLKSITNTVFINVGYVLRHIIPTDQSIS